MLEDSTRNQLNSLFDEAARRAASRVRREHPDLVGVLVHGSVAREEAGPFSDIDLLAVARGGRKPSDFSYFDGDIYVGIGFLRLADLEREFTDPKAFFWARGSAESTRILYDPKGILRALMASWKKAKPPHQVLEKTLWDVYHNIIEYSGKLRNGWRKKDEYLTRYAAMVIADWTGRAIVALNDLSINSENYIWSQISKAKKKPKHLTTDYPIAFGTKGTPETGKVFQSAMRLCRETLRLIRDSFGGRAKHEKFRSLLAEPLEKHGL